MKASSTMTVAVARSVSIALTAVLALSTLGDAAAARADLPVHQTVLPDGALRYSVPITVGGSAPLEAQLDTGSFGIRVLKSALRPDQYAATDIRRSYNFGGGAKFDGVLARAVLGVGPVRGAEPALFQLIETVGCIEGRPHCFASRVKPEDYRIGGDGYPKEGFSAIFGISMQRAVGGDSAQNPLAAARQSWILTLPRPGEAAPGHLVVDPDPAERSGFKMLQLNPEDDRSRRLAGWADAAVPACLVPEEGGAQFCGAALLDSGTADVVVMTDTVTHFQPWGGGKKARLEIGGADGPASVAFTSGQDHASRVILRPPWLGGTQIITGPLPFYAYDVLYDAATGTIGFRPRVPAEAP